MSTEPDPTQAPAMSEEEAKQLMIGKANYSLLVIMTCAAFCCGFYADVYCNFVDRQVTFKPGFNLTEACASLGLDAQYEGMCNTLLDYHGVGFYAWMGTVPVNQQVCFSYTMWNPAVQGWITPEFDTKFNTAVAMAICANVFGGVAFFTFMFSACCPVYQDRLRLMGNYFFLACLFQGLSLLIFRSDICQVGFFDQYFPNGQFGDVVESVKCTQGPGSRMAIAATVLYWVCMGLAQKAVAPMPFGYQPPTEQATYNQAWNRKEGPAGEAQQPPPPPAAAGVGSDHEEA